MCRLKSNAEELILAANLLTSVKLLTLQTIVGLARMGQQCRPVAGPIDALSYIGSRLPTLKKVSLSSVLHWLGQNRMVSMIRKNVRLSLSRCTCMHE